uniref:NADH-ubiquinone oxidoreductase chain 4 n=1 Tax=Platerodrilus sp. MNCN/DNA:86739 TaxID=1905348 RepID=A0A342Z5E9_9COLE|nr:NADH dehydrogenase subunit 4 [Platerodrilus sp. MNCN/DNA:86739]
MMKFLLFLLFVIPLCLNYFLFMLSYFILILLFILSFNISWFFSNISYNLGCDYISFFLILLMLWICLLMILATEELMNYLFLLILLMLSFSLFITFSTYNLFLFYLFFEFSMIPTLILILGWGYQPDRVQAGMYMFMYMMLVSLPMLLAVFYIYRVFGSLNYNNFGYINSYFLYFCINMGFFVKMPMFLTHLWLPKAHVEAPIAGSMILAGIMLKLGGYGLIRVLIMFLNISLFVNFYIILISLLGGTYITLICLRQSDIKSLIAYSSISHMSLVLSGLMTMNLCGLYGALIMMIAHGLCSSALFCLANITYSRVGSRSLFLNKGFINLIPTLSMFWFFFCCFNMSAPPSLNFLGEILLISSIVSWSYFTIIFLMMISFFSASYSLYLYSFSQHGKNYSGIYSFSFINIREFSLIFMHLVPLFFMVMVCDMFM